MKWKGIRYPRGYPMAGLPPGQPRHTPTSKKAGRKHRNLVDLTAPIIYLPPAHPKVGEKESRPLVESKPDPITFSGRALITTKSVLRSPEDILAEVRAMGGSTPGHIMDRLFRDLDVERLIQRAINQRDPYDRMDAMDRRLFFAAEAAGRGRFWLQHEIDWRDIPPEQTGPLLDRAYAQLCDERRCYGFALHAVEQHARIFNLTRIEALQELAEASAKERFFVESNGQSPEDARAVVDFLASVQREKTALGLFLPEHLSGILDFERHVSEAIAASKTDILVKAEEYSRSQPPSVEDASNATYPAKGYLPKPPPPIPLPKDKVWIVMRLVALVILLAIAFYFWWDWSRKSKVEAPRGGSSQWFDLMRSVQPENLIP